MYPFAQTAEPHRQDSRQLASRYSIGLTGAQNPDQEKQPPRVSIVVVSRNRAELLERCLQSLEKAEGRETLQIIVVDNGSSDGAAHPSSSTGAGPATGANMAEPRNANDARAAFDSLFKKPE